MKLGTFIVAALCAATTTARADHAALIAQYQQQYGDGGDPHLLTLIGDEYRSAGDAKQALAYYCSYLYVASSGDDADDASAKARAIQSAAGRHVASDHDACTAAPTVTQSTPELLATMPYVPPRISKREIGGLATIGVAIAGFGAALYEAKQNTSVTTQLDAIDPHGPLPANYVTMENQAAGFQNREKLWLAVSGVALVTGGVLYLTGRHDRLKAEHVLVGPSVGRSSAGIVLGGAF